MPTLDSLETPAPVVDLARLDSNLDRVATYAKAHSLSLRPHIKTHKSPVIAAEQLRRGAVGLTCATPHEATVMSATCDDLLVMYPPVGDARVEHLLGIPDHVRLTVGLDSREAADALAAGAVRHAREVGVYVELDVGMKRVGLPGVEDAIGLARHVAATPHLRFAGIAFYPGHVRTDVREQDAALQSLDAVLRSAVERFADAGVMPDVVSGGSTPTLFRTHELSAVTEFRPGTYVYNDRSTAAIGACDWQDIALTVLATVISTAVPGQAVIDAGTKSLGREPLRAGSGADAGFGALLDRPEVTVSSMSEEHGILDLSRTDWRPKVGERVRVVPNHVCIVVHLNDVVFGVRGEQVERRIAVAARGRGY